MNTKNDRAMANTMTMYQRFGLFFFTLLHLDQGTVNFAVIISEKREAVV
jgi:hypothetical protein